MIAVVVLDAPGGSIGTKIEGKSILIGPVPGSGASTNVNYSSAGPVSNPWGIPFTTDPLLPAQIRRNGNDHESLSTGRGLYNLPNGR